MDLLGGTPKRWEPLSTTLVSGSSNGPQIQLLTCPFHKLPQLFQGEKTGKQKISSSPVSTTGWWVICAMRCSNDVAYGIFRQIQFSTQALGPHPACCSEVVQVQQDPTRLGEMKHEVMASQMPLRETQPMFASVQQ